MFYKKMPLLYYSNKTLINMQQRKIIINCIAYYELNENLLSDKQYDQYVAEYFKFIENKKEDLKQSQYYYCFESFDRSTGFDLYDKLTDHDKNYLTHLSTVALNLKRGNA